MGESYMKDECIEKEAHEINGGGSGILGLLESNKNDGVLTKQCCSPEPLITCHFRDKPSKIPCPDSPAIDSKFYIF